MTGVDKTTLHIETLLLMFLLFMFGMDWASAEATAVSLLFVIAAMLSMLKYRVNQQARGET